MPMQKYKKIHNSNTDTAHKKENTVFDDYQCMGDIEVSSLLQVKDQI